MWRNVTDCDGQNVVLNKNTDYVPFFLLCVVCIKHSIMTISEGTVSFHRILAMIHFNHYSWHSYIYFDDMSNVEIVRHISSCNDSTQKVTFSRYFSIKSLINWYQHVDKTSSDNIVQTEQYDYSMLQRNRPLCNVLSLQSVPTYFQHKITLWRN